MMDTPRQLRRVSEGAWLGGVSTGLAQYFNVDPVLVRVGWVVLALLSGAGLAIYLLCWSFIPDVTGRRTWIPLIVLLVLVVVPFCCFLGSTPFMMLGNR